MKSEVAGKRKSSTNSFTHKMSEIVHERYFSLNFSYQVKTRFTVIWFLNKE